MEDFSSRGRADLFARAKEAMLLAHVPYSNFPVGAAAWTSRGIIVEGCNIENASFGLTLCAEVTLLANAVCREAGAVEYLVVVDRSGNTLSPCGRCRQMLVELAGPNCRVASRGDWMSLPDLLPGAFTRRDMDV
jgi:cytidine deaminase